MNEFKDKIVNVSVEDILPNRFQPRLAFDEKELNDLSESIVKYGIIQPIVLRQIGDKYEIIAGERRYKASVLAGLKTIPAIINNTDDNTSAEIALLENLQRKNLTVIEEAQSFKKLIDRGFTQDEISNKHESTNDFGVFFVAAIPVNFTFVVVVFNNVNSSNSSTLSILFSELLDKAIN